MKKRKNSVCLRVQEHDVSMQSQETPLLLFKQWVTAWSGWKTLKASEWEDNNGRLRNSSLSVTSLQHEKEIMEICSLQLTFILEMSFDSLIDQSMINSITKSIMLDLNYQGAWQKSRLAWFAADQKVTGSFHSRDGMNK